MKIVPFFIFLLGFTLFACTTQVKADAPSPLANEVILIIRHAEKVPDGPGLTQIGQQRANLYVGYFENFHVDSKLRPPDSLFAAADSANAQRCRLTITPLSQALNLPIDTSIKNKHIDELAQEIETHPGGKTILICWHHEEIANIIQALGADPTKLIPGGDWPDDRYNWLIELRYDGNGHLVPAKCQRITERILPGDGD